MQQAAAAAEVCRRKVAVPPPRGTTHAGWARACDALLAAALGEGGRRAAPRRLCTPLVHPAAAAAAADPSRETRGAAARVCGACVCALCVWAPCVCACAPPHAHTSTPRCCTGARSHTTPHTAHGHTAPPSATPHTAHTRRHTAPHSPRPHPHTCHRHTPHTHTHPTARRSMPSWHANLMHLCAACRHAGATRPQQPAVTKRTYEVAGGAVLLGQRSGLPAAIVVCFHGILPRLPLLLLQPCRAGRFGSGVGGVPGCTRQRRRRRRRRQRRRRQGGSMHVPLAGGAGRAVPSVMPRCTAPADGAATREHLQQRRHSRCCLPMSTEVRPQELHVELRPAGPNPGAHARTASLAPPLNRRQWVGPATQSRRMPSDHARGSPEQRSRL